MKSVKLVDLKPEHVEMLRFLDYKGPPETLDVADFEEYRKRRYPMELGYCLAVFDEIIRSKTIAEARIRAAKAIEHEKLGVAALDELFNKLRVAYKEDEALDNKNTKT